MRRMAEGKSWRAVCCAEEAKERHKQMCRFRMATLALLWRLDRKKARLAKSISLGDHWS